MRKLASIQTITALSPIEGADKIQVADILGWKVVVEKDKFNVGEKVVYCEIDSILPPRPEFEFLSRYNYRIKTIKLKGQISQGICFKVKEVLPLLLNYNDGDDVTDKIGVIKYEPKQEVVRAPSLYKKEKKAWVNRYIPKRIVKLIYRYFPSAANLLFSKKPNIIQFPSFIPKTDETRVQTYTADELKRLLSDSSFSATEKLDGTSCTMYLKDGKFGVCSRNRELAKDDSVYWEAAEKYHVEDKLRKYGKNIAIQGEIIGPCIQGNKYKLDNILFYVFNVYDIDNKKYLSNTKTRETVNMLWLLNVPLVHLNMVFDTEDKDLINNIVLLSDGYSVINHKVLREGLVWRKNTVHWRTVSFKAVSNRFLLRNGE